ncbi:MAG: hypothetical protein ACRC80_23185 [Waterburya sp.]
MLNHNKIIKEIEKVQDTIINVKNELTTLKNRVRAYKGWTKKYRQQQKALQQEVISLKNDHKIVCQQKDQVNQENKELKIKQQELLENLALAQQAIESREKSLSKLDDIIAKIEQYKKVCERANKIAYADKVYLIQEAEKIFCYEQIVNLEFDLDSREYTQMFTDQASINRNLLNN